MQRTERGMLAATIAVAVSTTALLILTMHLTLEEYLIHFGGTPY